MTVITPSPQPAGRLTAAAPGDAPSSVAGMPNFAALLSVEQSAGSNDPQVVSTLPQSSQFRCELAQLFNAFGFFQPSVTPGGSQLDHAQAPTEPEVSEAEVAAAKSTVYQADASSPLAEPESRLHDADAENGRAFQRGDSRPHAPPDHSRGPREAQHPVFSLAPPAKPDTQFVPVGRWQQEAPDTWRRQAPLPLDSAPGRQLAMPTLRETHFENRTEMAEAAPTKQAKFDNTASETRLKVIFRIADHVVEMVARFGQLSNDEEEQLLSRLQALLEEHGLTLGAARINGLAIEPGLFRSFSK